MANKETPDEIKGWSWGAFFLSWIWGFGNSTYIALLALIPIVNLVFIFILGAKGNEWAWKNKDWKSIEEFKNTQRKWRTAGWIVWGLSILIVLAIVIGIISNGSDNVPAAYQPLSTSAQTNLQASPSPTSVANNQNAASALTMKEQCSVDGQKYFQSDILPNYSLQVLNQEFAAAGPDFHLENVTIPDPTYAYNQAMNTCLIDFTLDETYSDYKGLINSFGYWIQIDDIYTNRAVTDIGILPDGTVTGYVGETKEIFDANEQNLMVDGEECDGGNGNCG